MTGREMWRVWKAALAGWWNDSIPRHGASLSYYTLFSLAPILIVSIAVAGFVFGREAVQGEVARQLDGLIGSRGAEAIQTVIKNSREPSIGNLASIFGTITFVLGATGVFLELENALNSIWRVPGKTASNVVGFIMSRLISFGMVVGVGFVLLVSLVVSALISFLGGYLERFLPGFAILWQIVNLAVSLGVVTLLFAMIYKVLPNVDLSWRDVWTGAAVTAVLFTIGKFFIGLYLGQSSVASTYGAAGSVVVLLVWVYYSSQVVLLGAEFTKAYTERRRAMLPRADAPPTLPADEAADRNLATNR